MEQVGRYKMDVVSYYICNQQRRGEMPAVVASETVFRDGSCILYELKSRAIKSDMKQWQNGINQVTGMDQ